MGERVADENLRLLMLLIEASVLTTFVVFRVFSDLDA